MATSDTKTGVPCFCGCGETANKRYRPGHDAKHVAQLRRAYSAGEITRAKARAQIKGSPALLSKLDRSLAAVDKERADAKAAAKPNGEAA